MFFVVEPLALIYLPVDPVVNTDSLHFSVLVMARVVASVLIFLIALSVSQIVLPLSLVNLSIVVHHYTETVSFLLFELSVVHSLLVLF